ncbi:hypothetical protein QFZ73_002930 [Peribacillus sp. V2I11]|nr:hypothetical protein [Peribacillus sp. V2I11]
MSMQGSYYLVKKKGGNIWTGKLYNEVKPEKKEGK